MRVQSVLGYLFYLFLFNSRLLFFLFDSYGSSIGAPLEHYLGDIGVREMKCGHNCKEGKGLRSACGARATVWSSPRSHQAQARTLPDLNQGRADLQAAALTIEVPPRRHVPL